MKRPVLENKSPIDVVEHMVDANDQEVNKLTQHMKAQRQKQVQKKYQFQNKDFVIVTTRTQGYGYRLNIPPTGFSKEIDFRMGLELHYLNNYDTQNVILSDW